MSSLDRRTFLSGAAAVAACSGVGAAGPEVGAREVMRELPYGAVKLTGGPLAEQYAWVKAHYLALNDDDLLHGYRRQAGLKAPGVELGGWYATDGFVPGHSWGQYVSGLARMGATGDAACVAKVRNLVGGFAETLGVRNVSVLRPETNLWKCYTLDKHFAGLLDACSLASMGDGREVMVRVLDGAQGWLPKVGRDRAGKKDPPYDETYVMPENLFAAGAVTGDGRFGELARRYMLDAEFFEPLARGEDVLPGKHAYSHAIALSSAGKAWVDGGDAKYLRAMRNAFEFLTAEQQFASGGWGPNEQFVETGRGLRYAALSSTVDHFETPCGAYAATKLARYLLRATGEAQYGDNLERVVWNTVLGVKRPDEAGDYPYYSTYGAGAVKTFYKAKWPCCSGTLVQTVADYVLNLYLQTGDGIVVNMFAPSEVRWRQGGREMGMVQETEYPVGETVRLRLRMEGMERFAVRVRIPAWAVGATAAVNGERVEGMRAGSFLVMRRRWLDGDRVEVKLPQRVRVEAVDAQHPRVAAVMRGAVMYVAVGDVAAGALRLPEGLVEEGEALRLRGTAMRFVPFYRVKDERYSTYLTRV